MSGPDDEPDSASGLSMAGLGRADVGALARCRLCWSVTAAVFAAILLIEAVILVLSVRKFERDQISGLDDRGRVAMVAALHAVDGDPQRLAAVGGRLFADAEILGARIVAQDGMELARFGLSPAEAPDRGVVAVRWEGGELGHPFEVEALLDGASLPGERLAYIGRIIILILAIALFTTMATMLVLGRTVMAPLLRLRDQAQAAGADPVDPARHRIEVSFGSGEMGELAATFNRMLGQLGAAIGKIDAQKRELAQARDGLEAQVAERTAELTELNQLLRREIAGRREAEREVKRIAALPDRNPNPVFRIDRGGAVVYANTPAEPLLSFWRIKVGDLLPEPWREVAVETFAAADKRDFELAVEDKIYALSFRPPAGDGEVTLYGRDVTEGRAAESRLRHLVNHDLLTGLPNRILFLDRLEQACRGLKDGDGLAVLLIDLDNFKEINDELGITAGDQVIQMVAERVSACLAGTSDTVARLGGDDFAVLYEGGGQDGDRAAALAQKLIDAVVEPLDVGGRTLVPGASVGIAMAPNDGTRAEDLLGNAELAMYRTKEQGRGTFTFFVTEMEERVRRHRALESDLRHAIDNGELLLYYQPKLHLVRQRVEGAEALMRWLHPERGFLSPAEFIPVAEKSRLIAPMGKWALWSACAQAKVWQDQGIPPLKVAVNLSATQFLDETLSMQVKYALLESGLDPCWLELEITESAVMEDAEGAIKVLRTLADLGVSVSVDDFGTGYSSLVYLKRFPLHRVKIDKAFVDDLGTPDNSGAIARAVTTLGHSFGMEVTAEGVETVEQLSFLHSLGCNEIQGYLFSKPLAVGDATAFLAAADDAVRKTLGGTKALA